MPLPRVFTRLIPLICLASVTAMAAPKATPRTLAIGDPAPPFTVKWIKGTPTAKLEKDRVYVVEFWATWCGPCKVAMPHLSELAKQYEGKVVVIGVNVHERAKAGQPYESVYPMVKKFVDDMGNKMAYGVAMDINGQPMVAQWLDAAAQSGIPATFLIKDGKVAWVGHPSALDKVIPAVLDGTFDGKAFASEFKEATLKAKDLGVRQQAFLERLKPINALATDKKYAEALKLVDAELAGVDAEFKPLLEDYQMRMCLHVDEARFLTLAEKLLKASPPEAAMLVAEMVLSSDTTSPKLLRQAIDWDARVLANLPKTATSTSRLGAYLNNQVALGEDRSGNLPKAIEAQERAVAHGKKALGEEATEEVQKELERYEKALAAYRQKQGSK